VNPVRKAKKRGEEGKDPSGAIYFLLLPSFSTQKEQQSTTLGQPKGEGREERASPGLHTLLLSNSTRGERKRRKSHFTMLPRRRISNWRVGKIGKERMLQFQQSVGNCKEGKMQKKGGKKGREWLASVRRKSSGAKRGRKGKKRGGKKESTHLFLFTA